MSTLRVTAIQSATGSQEVSQTTVYSGTAKVWSNLNGTGTIAERDSFNITSYTDTAVGRYDVNIANNMADGNYFCGGLGDFDIGTSVGNLSIDSDKALQVGEYPVVTFGAGTNTAAHTDAKIVATITHGNLA